MSKIVVKFGGNAITPDSLDSFANDIAQLTADGHQLVVIHGGGPQISARLKERGIEPPFVKGRRVTTGDAVDVVRAALNEEVQPEFVARIDGAVGVNSTSDAVFGVVKELVNVDGEEVDLGFVGTVTSVETVAIEPHLDAGMVPVVSSVGRGSDGQIYNVNADNAAGPLAAELNADLLVLMTDVDGLYARFPDPKSRVDNVTVEELEEMFDSLDGGMIPKVEACLIAAKSGVRAQIINGKNANELVRAVHGHKVGTVVSNEQREINITDGVGSDEYVRHANAGAVTG